MRETVYVLTTADPQSELVRHFLIEPTSKGVRLKGCSNEPVFGKFINNRNSITLSNIDINFKNPFTDTLSNIDSKLIIKIR